MNNDTDPDIRPGTEERVAAAMRSLAATHMPDPQPRQPTADSSRRRMLAVAASAVLVVGLGALLLVSTRETDSSADRLPQTETNTVATNPVDSGSVLPAAPAVYSATPLGDDVVPVVRPAPAEPVRGFQLGLTDWTNGIDNGTTFVAMEDGQIVGSIQVVDSPAPWDVMSEGEDVVEIDGRQAVRVESSDERGFFIQIDGGTRAALDTSPPSHALGIDSDIADLLRLIGDEPLDRFDDTGRFLRVPVESTRGRSISYGTDAKVELLQLSLEPGADADAVDRVAEAYQLFITQSGSFQISEVVQVSPVDLVVIVARNENDLAAATRGLQLVPVDESGVDFATYGAFAGDEPVARSEPSWGRWQLTIDAAGGNDCRLFQVHVWRIDGVGGGYTDCGERNPVRADGSQVFCVALDLEIVGAVLGATTPPEFAVGDDIDGLVAEREDTSTSEFGASTTFRIVQSEPGANIRAATVLVDGVEIDCSG